MFLGLDIGSSILKKTAFYIPNFGPPRGRISEVSDFGLGAPSISPPNSSFLPYLGECEICKLSHSSVPPFCLFLYSFLVSSSCLNPPNNDFCLKLIKYMFFHKVKYCIFYPPFRNHRAKFSGFQIFPFRLGDPSKSLVYFSFLPYLEVG
jgi:hypothetical protein